MQCYADYAALKHSNSQCYLAEKVQYTGRMEYFLNVTLERASGWHQRFGIGSISIMCGRRCQHTRPMLQIYAVRLSCAYADMAGVAMYKLTDKDTCLLSETRSMLDL